MEQQFKLKQIENALSNPDTKKEDIITVFMALQRQTFVLSNNVINLVSKWPAPTKQDQAITEGEKSNHGISFGTKD
jgi:hypothetical protein